MVGTVERWLSKIIGKARLHRDELNVILIEVESVLNSCSIAYQWEELESHLSRF